MYVHRGKRYCWCSNALPEYYLLKQYTLMLNILFFLFQMCVWSEVSNYSAWRLSQNYNLSDKGKSAPFVNSWNLHFRWKTTFVHMYISFLYDDNLLYILRLQFEDYKILKAKAGKSYCFETERMSSVDKSEDITYC